jgi:hypothetical protein
MMMTPNGQLTELRVWKMIREEIASYDVGNARRHEENTKKLDRLIWGAIAIFATSAGALALEIVRLSLAKGQ